jgi:hypothetical protein
VSGGEGFADFAASGAAGLAADEAFGGFAAADSGACGCVRDIDGSTRSSSNSGVLDCSSSVKCYEYRILFSLGLRKVLAHLCRSRVVGTKTFSESHTGKPLAGLVREDAKAAVKTIDASVSGAFQAARSSLGVIIAVVCKDDAAINKAEIEAVEACGGGKEESQTLCETSRCGVRVDKDSRTVCDFGDVNSSKNGERARDTLV